MCGSNDRGVSSSARARFCSTASVVPTVIDVDKLQRRLDRPDYQLVKRSLREVGFGEVKEAKTGEVVVMEEGIDLLATYAGQASLLKEWSRGAQINTDRNLRLQYLAGMWLNSSMGEQILGGIRSHFRFPEQTFVGSPERVRMLKEIRYLPVRWR